MALSAADIRSAEVFGALTEMQREEVALGGEIVTRDKGEYVYRAGETADFLYIVRDGRVGMYADSHDGMLHPISILSSGQTLGIGAFFSIASWTLTARCLSVTRLLVIPRRWILSHMIGDAELELRILQGVVELERRTIGELAAIIAETDVNPLDQAFSLTQATTAPPPSPAAWPDDLSPLR